MAKKPTTSAADFIPADHSLPALAAAAAGCQGCELYQHATQTVFGEGPQSARVMIVGEVPGDQEDRQGKPFIGPAGKLLDEALAEVGFDRSQVYVTNAVKHFKWEAQGKRRLHKTPRRIEVNACKPWLESEIAAVQPKLIICLGATAAQSLLGASFRVTQQRGEILPSAFPAQVMATYHPSAILRAPTPEARAQMRSDLVADLRKAAEHLAG